MNLNHWFFENCLDFRRLDLDDYLVDIKNLGHKSYLLREIRRLRRVLSRLESTQGSYQVDEQLSKTGFWPIRDMHHPIGIRWSRLTELTYNYQKPSGIVHKHVRNREDSMSAFQRAIKRPNRFSSRWDRLLRRSWLITKKMYLFWVH